MSTYFQLKGAAVRRHNQDCDWWVMAIDRRPHGHLSSFCQEVPLAHRAGDCCYTMQRDRVLALKVPESVAVQFSTEPEQTYVTETNLAAFLSYIYDHNYTDVDMAHVDPTGVWLVYDGVVDSARTDARRPAPASTVPTRRPAPTRSGTTNKPAISRYARVRKNVAK